MLSPSTKTRANTEGQKKAREALNEALEAINQPLESFTEGRYNILRVIAAYPLEVGLESRSKYVKEALQRDKHTLALLQRSALVAAVATNPRATSILTMLMRELKEKRGETHLGGDTEMRCI